MGQVISMSSRRSTRERWIDKPHAAEYLGRSVRWVGYRQVDSGLPYHLRGNKSFYLRSELDAWVASGRTGGAEIRNLFDSQ